MQGLCNYCKGCLIARWVNVIAGCTGSSGASTGSGGGSTGAALGFKP